MFMRTVCRFALTVKSNFLGNVKLARGNITRENRKFMNEQ